MDIFYKIVTRSDIELMISLNEHMMKDEQELMKQYDETTYRKNWNHYPIEENANCDVILCFDQGEVIGRVDLMYELSYMDFSTVGYIDWIYIRETYRGKGIGKKLLLEAEKLFRKKKCEKYYLFIAKNDVALKFYESTDLDIMTMKTGEKKL